MHSRVCTWYWLRYAVDGRQQVHGIAYSPPPEENHPDVILGEDCRPLIPTTAVWQTVHYEGRGFQNRIVCQRRGFVFLGNRKLMCRTDKETRVWYFTIELYGGEKTHFMRSVWELNEKVLNSLQENNCQDSAQQTWLFEYFHGNNFRIRSEIAHYYLFPISGI